MRRVPIVPTYARFVAPFRCGLSVIRNPHPQHVPTAFKHSKRKLAAIIRPEWHPARTRDEYNALEERAAVNRRCQYCCKQLTKWQAPKVFWNAGYERKYCDKHCSYMPKARGRFIIDLFANMILERLPNERRPTVFTREVAERLKARKAEKPFLKFLRSSVNQKEYWAAARRMVYFGEKEGRGLLVKLVDKDGIPMQESRSPATDLEIGVQYMRKREKFEAATGPQVYEDDDELQQKDLPGETQKSRTSWRPRDHKEDEQRPKMSPLEVAKWKMRLGRSRPHKGSMVRDYPDRQALSESLEYADDTPRFQDSKKA